MSGMLLLITGRGPPDVHHPVTYQYVLPWRVRSVTSLRSFPASRRRGDRSLYLSGVLGGGEPVKYVIYCHLCTKYELICSFYHSIRGPPNVRHSVTFTFRLWLRPRRVRVVTSLRSFPASRRPGELSLYLSGVLRGGEPVLYVIYCLFRTEYELICSFYTF